MKYEKGDRVVFKPRGLMEQESLSFSNANENALRGTDRAVTITDTFEDGTYGCDHLGYCVSTDAILGYAFEWGEEIEVSNDGENFAKKLFIAYTPGSGYPYRAMSHTTDTGTPQGAHGYTYARPIRKPEIEITVKINGEESTLLHISEETMLRIRKWEKDNG